MRPAAAFLAASDLCLEIAFTISKRMLMAERGSPFCPHPTPRAEQGRCGRVREGGTLHASSGKLLRVCNGAAGNCKDPARKQENIEPEEPGSCKPDDADVKYC